MKIKQVMTRRVPLLFLLVIGLFAYVNDTPSVFLIGDSISIQYGPYLEQYLDGVVQLTRKKDDGNAEKNLDVPTGANGGDSRMVLAYLRSKIAEPAFHPDYLLINCGLHDIKRDPQHNVLQVTADDYRANLVEIMQLLQQKGIRPVWIRTTAVVDTIHNSRSRSFHRFAKDLAVYNQIADEVCAQARVPVIDLYGFTWKLGIEQFTDHVHYKEPVRALQAAYIAGQVTQLIRNK